jgi:hypothetical protein
MSCILSTPFCVANTAFKVGQDLHQNGHDDLLWSIFFGGLCGLVCALPALVVSANKGLNTAAFFWINVIAGAAAAVVAGTSEKSGILSAAAFEAPGPLSGLLFAIPVGTVLLIVAFAQKGLKGDGTPNQDAGDGRWTRILCPAATLVLCLVVLPQKCTDKHTVTLPDNRSWLEKLTGVAPPTTTVETPSWGPVFILTGIFTVVAFAAGMALADDQDKNDRI